MTRLWNALPHLLHDESGQDLIEYGLVAALVALGVVASMQSLASNIGSTVGNLATALGVDTSS